MLLRKIAAVLLSAALLSVPAAPGLRAEAAGSASRLSSIESALKRDKAVAGYAVSHDASEIAVARTAKNGGSFSILAVSSGRESAVPMSGAYMNLYSPAWSYDDRYVLVNDGTAVQHAVYVIDPVQMRRRLTVAVAGAVLWAPASHSFAFLDVDPAVPLVLETELDGAEQLKVYNVDTLIWHRYVHPDPRYVYTLRGWSAAGLAVDRYELPGEAKTPLLLDVKA